MLQLHKTKLAQSQAAAQSLLDEPLSAKELEENSLNDLVQEVYERFLRGN